MFEGAMRKSMEEYLRPGEELLHVAIVQAKGMIGMAVAGGAMTLSAKELLSEVPIAEVDSLEVGKGTIGKPVTITIRGESLEVVLPKASSTDKLVDAFQQAKASGPAVT